MVTHTVTTETVKYCSPGVFSYTAFFTVWAAFCLGFFGFMRAGEFTCPSQEAFQSDMLSPGDVCVDSHDHPTRVAIHLKRSKTDPFGAGTTIHLGRTGSVLCPVVAMLNYLAIRPPKLGPPFMFHDGSTLSRPRLVHSLRQVLREVGIDDSQLILVGTVLGSVQLQQLHEWV